MNIIPAQVEVKDSEGHWDSKPIYRKEGRKEGRWYILPRYYSNYVLGNLWTRNHYLGKVYNT